MRGLRLVYNPYPLSVALNEILTSLDSLLTTFRGDGLQTRNVTMAILAVVAVQSGTLPQIDGPLPLVLAILLSLLAVIHIFGGVAGFARRIH